ncbi:MAG: hypothetical protein M3462_05595 [Chloroflexota bacterium]|nr:hypothetical protein [Chloroflexota bacterium]
MVHITPALLEFGFATRGQDVADHGLPEAAGGRLVTTDMDTDQDSLEIVLPAAVIGGAIEEVVNGYLAASGLRLRRLHLGSGQMTLTTAAA